MWAEYIRKSGWFSIGICIGGIAVSIDAGLTQNLPLLLASWWGIFIICAEAYSRNNLHKLTDLTTKDNLEY